MRKWGYLDDAQSVDCDCGEPQTMAHLLSCRLLDEACTADDLATVIERAKACAHASGRTLCEGHDRRIVTKATSDQFKCNLILFNVLLPLDTVSSFLSVKEKKSIETASRNAFRKTKQQSVKRFYGIHLCSSVNQHEDTSTDKQNTTEMKSDRALIPRLSMASQARKGDIIQQGFNHENQKYPASLLSSG